MPTTASPTTDARDDQRPVLLTRRMALAGTAALVLPIALARQATASPVAAPAAAPRQGSIIMLDSNENPYGPSPAARAAIVASASAAPRYARDTIRDLVAAIAKLQGVTKDQVMLGAGSGELLHIATLLALGRESDVEVIAPHPTYEELPEFATALGAKVVWVPLDPQHRHDLKAMRAAVTPRTRLIYVCNPNNPTGTAVSREALEAFIRSVPKEVLVAVDEAYIDLADDPAVGSVLSLVATCPNLVLFRTFSKLHGLAGLRIGYSVAGPQLAARLRPGQLTWPNITGLRAALASLGDTHFQVETRASLIADRKRVQAAIDRLGHARAESQGNFVFFDTGAPLAGFTAKMLTAGIQVGRHFDGYDNWARVTIGQRHEVDRFLAALPGALAPGG